MVVINISGAIREEGTDGPVGSKTWERTRNQKRKGSVFIFISWLSLKHLYQYTSQGEEDGRSLLLAPAFISEALGIVKSDSRDK